MIQWNKCTAVFSFWSSMFQLHHLGIRAEAAIGSNFRHFQKQNDTAWEVVSQVLPSSTLYRDSLFYSTYSCCLPSVPALAPLCCCHLLLVLQQHSLLLLLSCSVLLLFLPILFVVFASFHSPLLWVLHVWQSYCEKEAAWIVFCSMY